MRTKRERAKCGQCGKDVSLRTDGSGPIAHKCPHGRRCVSPAWSKSKASVCDVCQALRDQDVDSPGAPAFGAGDAFEGEQS